MSAPETFDLCKVVEQGLFDALGANNEEDVVEFCRNVRNVLFNEWGNETHGSQENKQTNKGDIASRIGGSIMAI